VLPLRWVNLPTTAFVLRDDYVSSIWLQRHWVDIEKIAPIMQIAVVAAEDQKFPNHYGFDFSALREVLSETGGPSRGASTITQQLAKNIYLWKGQSIFRKVLEAYFAGLLELFLPKERILELYLNVVEFGRGVYGVEPASQKFFDKSAAELSRIDASKLAAVLPSPKKMSAVKPSAYVYERAFDIRFSIRALGGVSYLPWVVVQ